MKVMALCRVNYNGTQYRAGDVFETDIDLGDAAIEVKDVVHEPAAEPVVEQVKPKRSRKKTEQ